MSAIRNGEERLVLLPALVRVCACTCKFTIFPYTLTTVLLTLFVVYHFTSLVTNKSAEFFIEVFK